MKWITTAEALGVLGIGRAKLRELQAVSGEAGLDPAWADIGQPGRPEYRWDESALSRWFREVCAWRASSSEATPGKSDGAKAGGTGRAPAPTTRPRSASRGRSSAPRPSASGGSLRELLKRRP